MGDFYFQTIEICFELYAKSKRFFWKEIKEELDETQREMTVTDETKQIPQQM